MRENEASIMDVPTYTETEREDIQWGIRGLQEKMAPPYFADRSVRRGHPNYQYNKYIVNWFTGLFGYAEIILPLCREKEKQNDWQRRIDAIKMPMQQLHEGTPPDNTEEMLEESEKIASEIVNYFQEALPNALAA